MSLFKKRVKDGLPDPNGPLSSHACSYPWTRALANREISGGSRNNWIERKNVVHTIGK